MASVHRSEKLARAQSAVIEARQKAATHAKHNGIKLAQDGTVEGEGSMPIIETNGATIRDGKAYLRGNPLKMVKAIICPKCKLPRLLYPRVGYGARDPPDPRQQYCKNEPPIILDKHDVHGQRKKGTKVKSQAKNKQKKIEELSPDASELSAPATPQTASFPVETFEFKTIENPSAKCPNRDSALGDHWKPVTQMATHLNGNCFLKRDRAAGREAVAKMSQTPADSRAPSPKPSANGKRARAADDNDGNGKKKQKLEPFKKVMKKATSSPSKLKDSQTLENGEIKSYPPSTEDVNDSIVVDPRPKNAEINWEGESKSQQMATQNPNSKQAVNGVKAAVNSKVKPLKITTKITAKVSSTESN